MDEKTIERVIGSRQIVINDGLNLGNVNRLSNVLDAMFKQSFEGASEHYFKKTSPCYRDLCESTGRKAKMQNMFQPVNVEEYQ